MSRSLDPLKETTQELHRFYFMIRSADQWYAIMKECRQHFGKNWHCQSKVLRKLKDVKRFGYYPMTPPARPIWFDIPNAAIATWIAVKLGVEVRSDLKHKPSIIN